MKDLSSASDYYRFCDPIPSASESNSVPSRHADDEVIHLCLARSMRGQNILIVDTAERARIVIVATKIQTSRDFSRRRRMVCAPHSAAQTAAGRRT